MSEIFQENDNKPDALVSCECAPNIALIKYWGKSNEELVLPLNGSISITLDSGVLSSRTCLALYKKKSPSQASSTTTTIQITLDASTQTFTDSPDQSRASKTDVINRKRFILMLNKVRSNCSLDDPNSYNLIRIVSVNSFPTASGMASSASGFASLAHCLARAFKYGGDTSELARLGSGSACRSCFGGFVLWSAPKEPNLPHTSVATQLFPRSHWPQLNILALVLHDKKKDVTSTDGMRETTRTSELLKYRVKMVQEERLAQMRDNLAARDFHSVAALTIKDSNNFHAVCMDTQPPLFYLNDASKQIISLVNQFNSTFGNQQHLVAYTFDAGPNAFLLVEDQSVHEFVYVLYRVFFKRNQLDAKNEDEDDEKSFVSRHVVMNESTHIDFTRIAMERKQQLDEFCSRLAFVPTSALKRIIHSKVGDEPRVYENVDKFSLLSFK